MRNQLIISVSREFGSGGHVIAEELARRFELPLYDNDKLTQITGTKSEDPVQKQFDFLKELAEAGKSFVVVGRCSETMLKNFPGMISIFILGDEVAKLKRIMEKYEMTEAQARQMIPREDWKRKSYHNAYCKEPWGDSRNYDLSINSSKLGISGTADFLESYINKRRAM